MTPQCPQTGNKYPVEIRSFADISIGKEREIQEKNILRHKSFSN